MTLKSLSFIRAKPDPGLLPGASDGDRPLVLAEVLRLIDDRD
jgi:hypothetical protein